MNGSSTLALSIMATKIPHSIKQNPPLLSPVQTIRKIVYFHKNTYTSMLFY